MSYTREQIEAMALDVRKIQGRGDLCQAIFQLLAENDALREDAARWRYARTILAIEHIEDAVKLCSGGIPEEVNNLRADQSIDAARHPVHAAITGEEVKEQSDE